MLDVDPVRIERLSLGLVLGVSDTHEPLCSLARTLDRQSIGFGLRGSAQLRKHAQTDDEVHNEDAEQTALACDRMQHGIQRRSHA